MAKLSVVTAFHNEGATAERFATELATLGAEAARRFGLSFETVLVDDGSSDSGAAEFAKRLEGDWKIVRLSRNFGKEAALLAGIEHASGDLIMTMDADMQHSAEQALGLVGELIAEPELDVVQGIRSNRSRDGWRRVQLAHVFYRAINLTQRFDIPENSSDFRVMRRPVAEAFSRLRDKRRFNKGLYAWAGFRQKLVPFELGIRAKGKSHWSRLNLMAFSLEGFTSFSVVPLRVMSLIGLVLAACGMIYGAKIILEVLLTGSAVPGYPSILVAVVVLGGFNLALLGLLGEYVWVAVSEVKDRPVYLVRDVMKPNISAQASAGLASPKTSAKPESTKTETAE